MDQTAGDRSIFTGSSFLPGNDGQLSLLVDLITLTLGIRIQPHHQNLLGERMMARVKTLGFASLHEYCQRLIATQQTPTSPEWQILIESLTITESYFFRDQGQCELLRNQILPELIKRKRQANGVSGKPSLRLWSAGCSTGEEAYSLAMLIQELLPDYPSWDVLILATDINQPSIKFAQQGIYSDWSFRTLAPELKNRYFRQSRKGWEIEPSIRKMVSFQSGNLVRDHYPDCNQKIYDLDLILCRNVFIYFDAKAIALVLEKFYRSLAPGGFLLTGHTELHGQNLGKFQVRNLPNSVIYQHPLIAESYLPAEPASKLNFPILRQAEKVSREISFQRRCHGVDDSSARKKSDVFLMLELETIQQDLLTQAKQLLAQKAYAEVIRLTKQVIALDSGSFQAYCLMAEAYANLGLYSEANQTCQQAIQINPLAIEPYLILAKIAEEQRDLNAAKLFLRRIIYLCPTSAYAYFELGSLYEQEANQKQAQKTWRSLLEILKNLPPEQPIHSNQKMTVAELQVQVFRNLNKASH